MHKTISQVVEVLCNLKDKVIEQLNKDQKRRESIKNNSRERFLGYVRKIDSTKIVLKYKSGGVYNREIFLLERKNTF